jgi:hypothetical protein
MTKLSADLNRVYESGNINEFPVAAESIIYQGAAVGSNSSGFAQPLKPTDQFLGFGEDCADNSRGSDGAKNIRVRKKGAVLLEISGITLADLNKPVYATDDNSFTLSPAGDAVYIGQISRIDSGGFALVEFSSSALRPAKS